MGIKRCVAVTVARSRATWDSLWLWEVLQDLIQSRSGLSWMWTIRGRRRYHPSATSPGPNGLPQTGMFDCVLCAYHIPTYSFYVTISAGGTVSRLTNGFSNPLVCWKFFHHPSPCFDAQAKNVLKCKHSLRLLSVSPTPNPPQLSLCVLTG